MHNSEIPPGVYLHSNKIGFIICCNKRNLHPGEQRGVSEGAEESCDRIWLMLNKLGKNSRKQGFVLQRVLSKSGTNSMTGHLFF